MHSPSKNSAHCGCSKYIVGAVVVGQYESRGDTVSKNIAMQMDNL